MQSLRSSADLINYQPRGIEIFSDLASLLEVFGNTSENKYRLIDFFFFFNFCMETGGVRHW